MAGAGWRAVAKPNWSTRVHSMPAWRRSTHWLVNLAEVFGQEPLGSERIAQGAEQSLQALDPLALGAVSASAGTAVGGEAAEVVDAKHRGPGELRVMRRTHQA